MSSRALERLSVSFTKSIERIGDLEAKGRFGAALQQYEVCLSVSSKINGLLAESEGEEQSTAAVAAAAVVQQADLDGLRLRLEDGAKKEVVSNKLRCLRRKASKTQSAAKMGSMTTNDASNVLSELLDEASNLLEETDEVDEKCEKLFDDLVLICSLWGESSAASQSRPPSALSLGSLQIEDGGSAETAGGQPERPAASGVPEATGGAPAAKDELVEVLKRVVDCKAPDAAACPPLPESGLEFETWCQEIRRFQELHVLTERQVLLILLDPRVIRDANLRASLHDVKGVEAAIDVLRGQLTSVSAIPRDIMAKWVTKKEPPHAEYRAFMRELRRDLQRIHRTSAAC